MWTENEPGVAAELGRLWRRARRRLVRVLLLALVGTSLVVGMRARRPRSYQARAVLRVTEGDLDPTTAPRPAKRLREHVLDVAMAAPNLLDLMRRRSLYQGQLGRDPTFAVESMREDITVEVWRNYFIEERQADEPARSARIAIAYRAGTPALAETVVADLVNLVVDVERSARVAHTRLGAEVAAHESAALRSEQTRRRTVIEADRAVLAHSDGPLAATLRSQITVGETQLQKIAERLTLADKRAADLELRASLEKAELGLRFEMVDAPHVPPQTGSRPLELVRLGLVVFLLLLPLCVIFVGAFDDRIYSGEDLTRLGIQPLGSVPAFDGDNLGALDDRLRRSSGANMARS